MDPLRAALDRISRPPLLTVLAGTVAAAMALRLAVHLLTLDAGKPAAMGDFLAFYTGARLIFEGRGAELYDLAVQAELQRSFAPVDPNGWLPYVNPPLLGAVLAPAAGLGIVGALYVFDLLCAGSFALAARALSPQLPAIRAVPHGALTALLLVLCFQPVIETMLRGQNSVLTLALITLCYAADRANRPALLGIALGLLSFKPQFGLLLGLVLVLRREWVAVAAAGLVSVGHYLLGAAISGWAWPRALLADIAAVEPGQPLATEICIRGALNFALPAPIAGPLGLVGALAAAAVAVVAAVRIGRDDPRFGLAWALLVVATVLASPHVQAYDIAILTLPVVILVDHLLTRRALSGAERALLLAAYVVAPLSKTAPALGFQPVFALVVALAAWIGLELRRAA